MSKIIFTSDIHITNRNPIARKDNYLEALGKKLVWLEKLRKTNDAIIIDAGDLLDKFEISSEMINWCFKFIPNKLHTIKGNHESKNHNHNLYHKTSLSVLENAGRVKIIDRYFINEVMFVGKNYGQKVDFKDDFKLNVLVTHEMVCEGKQEYDHFEYSTAKALLKKYPQFDIIISGHNHQSFKVDYEGRTLINVGSLMRRDVSQKEYQPRVMLYDTEDKTFEWVDVPIEKDVISTEHIDKVTERDERIDSFVNKLYDSSEVGLSFEQNMERYLSKNEIKEEVKQQIYECMGD